MFQQQLKQYVLSNPKLVSMKPAGDGIYVLKYSRRVFYDDLWNQYLEECRGTIVDQEFNLVTRPFTKIYNLGIEKQAPKLSDDCLVTAYRKVNGFMASVTWWNGDILVSTTGSTDSNYVEMAKQMMLTHMSWFDWQMEVMSVQGSTLLFEVVHPSDPHIVVEKPGMYFLGSRQNDWSSKIKGFGVDVANSWENYAKNCLNCYAPESYVITLGELKQKAKQCRHEGFVLYTQDNVSAKIKSPYYLIQKALARKKDICLLNKQLVEEEFFGLVEHLRSIKDQFNIKPEQDRLAYIRQYLTEHAL